MIHSETFHGTLPLHHFDSWGCIQKTLKNGKYPAKQENIIVKNISHEVQTDFAIVQCWELCVIHGIAPKAFISEAYQLHMLLMLGYLDKLERSSMQKPSDKRYFDPAKALAKLRTMEQEWLTYD